MLSFVLFCSSAYGQIFEGHFSTPIPVPRGSATEKEPLELRYNTFVKGKAVPRTVTITDLPKKQASETNAQAMERKAKTIADAINKELGAGHAAVLPMEEAVPKNFKGKIVKGQPWVRIYHLALGTDAKGVPLWQAVVPKDPTRQAGNGGYGAIGSGGKLSMGGVIRNGDLVDLTATGFDPDGERSIVEFGVDGFYVSTIMPEPGASDLSILAMLSEDLSRNGVRNSFDSIARSVTIEAAYDADEFTIYWTSTDVGLPFGAEVFSVPVPVPEPATYVMVCVGLGVLMARTHRRRSPKRA
mgnify:CR=1 FL=1